MYVGRIGVREGVRRGLKGYVGGVDTLGGGIYVEGGGGGSTLEGGTLEGGTLRMGRGYVGVRGTLGWGVR